MATYTKKLKQIEVHLIGNDTVFTFADTASVPMATQMLCAFEAHDVMKGEVVTDDVSKNVEIPFANVDHIVVTNLEDATIDKADPYGC